MMTAAGTVPAAKVLSYWCWCCWLTSLLLPRKDWEQSFQLLMLDLAAKEQVESLGGQVFKCGSGSEDMERLQEATQKRQVAGILKKNKLK